MDTIKIISLNIWGGTKLKELLEFIQSNDADIYCLQEMTRGAPRIIEWKGMYGDVFAQIQNILPEHTGHMAVQQENFFGTDFGIALFTRIEGEINNYFVHREKNAWDRKDNATMPKSVQTIKTGKYTIAHMHGLWNPLKKQDCPERIKQSNNTKKLHWDILVGDLNLLPEGDSLSILTQGKRNLIKEYNIKTTRTALYTKPIPWADYALVSPDVSVQHFSVPEVNCSDHRPLILNCN